MYRFAFKTVLRLIKTAFLFCLCLLPLHGVQAEKAISSVTTVLLSEEGALYPQTERTSGDERILDYDVTLVLDHSGKLDVTEKIRFLVKGEQIKLGIFRSLPTRYSLYGSTIATPVDVHSVTLDGKPENFWLEAQEGKTELLIGPEQDTGDNHVPYGEHTYVIHWSSENHIRSFNDYDELYFNATGNDWQFAIDNVSVAVVLPEEARIAQFAAYQGKFDSTQKALAEQQGNTVVFQTDGSLLPREGLTVAVGFAKGLVPEGVKPGPYHQLMNKILEATYPYLTVTRVTMLLILFSMLLYYLLIWLWRGRDEALGPITPLFELRGKISPAQAALVWKGKRYRSKDIFSAMLVSLASQGALRFQQEDATDRTKITALTLMEKHPATLLPDEAQLLSALFKTKTSQNLTCYNAQFNGVFNKYKQKLKTTLQELITRNGKFVFFGVILQIILLLAVPDAGQIGLMILALVIPLLTGLFSSFIAYGLLRAGNTGMAILVAILFLPASFSSLMLSVSTLPYMIFSLALLALHISFYYLLDKRAAQATAMLRQVKGLYRFMKLTDGHRYQVMTPTLFEKNLPYAMIFGLEKKWLKLMNDMYPGYIPSWQEGTISRRFISNIGNSVSRSTRAPYSSGESGSSSSRSRSSSFSSSGSGGRGSSGGGSGGGGGGGR